MEFILEELKDEDVAICANYISEEYELLTGTPPSVSRRGSLVVAALQHYTAYKVIDETGKIVAFIMYDDNYPYLHIVSWYIARGYRKSKPLYLISKTIADKVKTYEYVVFQRLHRSMQLPKSVCIGERIDNTNYLKWFNILEKRWG